MPIWCFNFLSQKQICFADIPSKIWRLKQVYSYNYRKQMASQENELILDEILNNISCQVQFADEQYYLLVKKQESGSHSLLFMTDFYENIWVQKINCSYLADLKSQLKVKTSLKVFADHLACGIKQECKIKQLKPSPILLIKMKISEGLIMNCRLKLENQINLQRKPQRFKSVLKVFGKQLFQAKNHEIKKAVDLVASFKLQQKMASHEKEQDAYENKLFAKPQVKMIPEKHRDLINPLRKKRMGKGMKIGKESESSDSES